MVATVTPTNDQLVKALQVGKLEERKGRQVQQQNALGEILKIVSANLNQPGESGPYQDKTTNPEETEGQKLERKGGYIDSGDPITDDNMGPDGRPLQIKSNPLDDATLNQGKFRNDARQRKIRNLVNEGATEGEKEAAKGKLKDQTDLPNFLQNINIKPQDLLKILQLIPAATGFNLQMAKADDDYGPGSKKYPQTPGKPWQIAGGPDYIGDKRTYGKLDRILNPLNDFKKPSLDQLRIHAANYPKA